MLTNLDVMILAGVATAGLVIMWIAFWFAVARRKDETISKILESNGFFRTIVVMGIIATTAVLSLAGKLEPQTATILSGVAGYVLGHISRTATSATEQPPATTSA
jgi:uncharacterized membrane protein YdjX (TVP38/TMEM64 family)